MSFLGELLTLLQAANIDCNYAAPSIRMPPLQIQTTRLQVAETFLKTAVFGNFLGALEGVNVNAVLFGETIDIEVYSPYLYSGVKCELFANRVVQVVARGFQTLPIQSIRCTACYYDPDTDCFRCKISVQLQTWLAREEE